MGHLELRVFHYVVWPAVLLMLCRWWFGPPTRFAFPWAFLASWLLLIHAQAVEVFLGDYPNATFLAAVWLTPLVVLVTCGPIVRALGHQVPKPTPLAGLPTSERDATVARLSPLITGAIVLLLLVHIYDTGVKNVALFFLFAHPGSQAASMVLRLSGLKSNISPVLTIIYSYSRALILPVYASVATALFIAKRIRATHWMIILGTAALYMLLEANKAPLAFTLVGALVSAYLANPERLKIGRMAGLLAVAMFIPALVYPLYTGDTGLDAVTLAGSRLWERVTLATSEACAQYFDAFPRIHPFLGLSSNRLWATIGNAPFVSTPHWVYDRYLDDGILHGGTVNAAFFATFYADWGFAGVIGGAVLVGLTLVALQLYFDRRPVIDAVTVGVRASTIVAVMQLMVSDYYGTALGRGMLSLPMLLWCFDIVRRRRAAVVRAGPLLRGADLT